MKKIKYTKTAYLLLTILFTLCLDLPAIASTTAPFTYNGAVQNFTAPVNGTYTLDVLGAQGGSYSGGNGGYGGHSTGNINLTAGQIIYIYVGGTTTTTSGGWNGGGSTVGVAKGGGGATDIRVGGTALSNRVIVAGGGGGAQYQAGGAGGGLTGTAGTQGFGVIGLGGTQTAGGTGGTSGSLGTGGNGLAGGDGNGGGGGGGGYYGGGGATSDGSGTDDSGGGGGSSYIGGVTAGTTSSNIQTGNGSATITYNAPGSPTSLTYTSINYSTTTISWQSVSMAISYKVYRNGLLIGTTTAPSTTYKDNNLTQNTQYIYTITALNTTMESLPSLPLVLSTQTNLASIESTSGAPQKIRVLLVSPDGLHYYDEKTQSALTLNANPVADQASLNAAGSSLVRIQHL